MRCIGPANCEGIRRRHRVTVWTTTRPTSARRDLHKLRFLFLRLVFIPILVWRRWLLLLLLILARRLRDWSRKLLMRRSRVYRLRPRPRHRHRLRRILHIRIELRILVRAGIRIPRGRWRITSITRRGSPIMRRRITNIRRSILQRGIHRRRHSPRASGISRRHRERAGHGSRTCRLRGRRHISRTFAFRHRGPVNRAGRVTRLSRGSGDELRGLGIAIPIRARIARMATWRIAISQIIS